MKSCQETKRVYSYNPGAHMGLAHIQSSIMFSILLPRRVCFTRRLSVCVSRITQKVDYFCWIFFGGMQYVTSKNWLDLGHDLARVTIWLRSGIGLRLQLPWRRFVLSDCSCVHFIWIYDIHLCSRVRRYAIWSIFNAAHNRGALWRFVVPRCVILHCVCDVSCKMRNFPVQCECAF